MENPPAIVPPKADGDYDRDNPKWFYPKVDAAVKEQLKQVEEEEQIAALCKDLDRVNALRDAEAKFNRLRKEVATKVAHVLPDILEEAEVTNEATVQPPYSIIQEIRNCPVKATVGQILDNNPKYQQQLKQMVTRCRRKWLPRVAQEDDVRMVCKDLGAPKLPIQVNSCLIKYVPVDGGSGVNIMIDSTADQLGYHELQPTARMMRLTDRARVSPKGILIGVPTTIGGIEFPLNYLIMKPARPSPFPVLLGRPWLYGAQVCEDWSKKPCSGTPRKSSGLVTRRSLWAGERTTNLKKAII